MPVKPLKPCRQPGCSALVAGSYCDKHKRQTQMEYDHQRGTASRRGYDGRWQKYSKWFLRQPGNQICKLRLDSGCTLVAKCVDHITPPAGPNDPLFWDPDNHQASCIHCNSVKGKRKIVGSEWEV